MEDLQSRLSFQDDTLQSLQDALAEQQQLVLRLQRRLLALESRLEEGSLFDQLPGDPAAEVPPHY
ncbi:MAG: hypothetical protein CME38_16280 [Haliea sp.]|nr:hypothetical protein [Haliea sp.]